MQKITIYGTKSCAFCTMAENLLRREGFEFSFHNIEDDAQTRADFDKRTNGARTVPQILVGEHLVGGYDKLAVMMKVGIFQQMVGGQ